LRWYQDFGEWGVNQEIVRERACLQCFGPLKDRGEGGHLRSDQQEAEVVKSN